MENMNGDKLVVCQTCNGEGGWIQCTKEKVIVKKGGNTTKTVTKRVKARTVGTMLYHGYACEKVNCPDCKGAGLVPVHE